MDLKVLFLSWAYPPMLYPRAVQVGRLAETLDCNIRVVSASRNHNFSKSGSRIEHECIPEELWRRYWHALVQRSFPRFLQRPDPWRYWSKKAAMQIMENSLLDDISVLVTFGQPMSDHLAGLEIHRKTGLPWIAHFSDPWLDNPFVKRDRASCQIVAGMEKAVVECADKLVFTSYETVKLVMGKYDSALASKVHVIPHAYDHRLFQQAKFDDLLPQDRCITIGHFGNFYGHRSPQPILDAIKCLSKHKDHVLENVRFKFVGGIEKSLQAKIKVHDEIKSCVEFCPSVSYEESCRLMGEVDGLVVIDAPVSSNAQESVFLPSKLIDYVGATKPIFAITPEGTTKRLVESLSCSAACPGDLVKIVDGIEVFVANLRNPNYAPAWRESTKSVRENFDRRVVAAQFRILIEDLARPNIS